MLGQKYNRTTNDQRKSYHCTGIFACFWIQIYLESYQKRYSKIIIRENGKHREGRWNCCHRMTEMKNVQYMHIYIGGQCQSTHEHEWMNEHYGSSLWALDARLCHFRALVAGGYFMDSTISFLIRKEPFTIHNIFSPILSASRYSGRFLHFLCQRIQTHTDTIYSASCLCLFPKLELWLISKIPDWHIIKWNLCVRTVCCVCVYCAPKATQQHSSRFVWSLHIGRQASADKTQCICIKKHILKFIHCISARMRNEWAVALCHWPRPFGEYNMTAFAIELEDLYIHLFFF